MRWSIFAACLIALAGCTDLGARPDYEPGVAAEDFVVGIDHPFLPLLPGAYWIYENGDERIEVRVLDAPRDVNGVPATVVRDTVTLRGSLVEDTWDWFAQDAQGNVWYLGEDTCEYEDGACIDEEGAWAWGVDGALPGIVLAADPMPGEPYFMEFYWPEAVDEAQVVAVGEAVETRFGTFTDTVTTKEWTRLEPDTIETVHYVAGIGVVDKGVGDDREVLVEYHVPLQSGVA